MVCKQCCGVCIGGSPVCIHVMDMFFLLFFPLCQVMSEKAFPVLDVITAKYGNPENTKRVRAHRCTHIQIMDDYQVQFIAKMPP